MKIEDIAFETMTNEIRIWFEATYDRIMDRLANEIKAAPESPIERAFLIGLLGTNFVCGTQLFRFEGGKAPPETGPWILVKCQARVENYRIDFLVECYDGEQLVGTIAVECDGHAFHERTKEQAASDRARDRALTIKGYKVIRFTGSEIYNRLNTCIVDLLNTVNAVRGIEPE